MTVPAIDGEPVGLEAASHLGKPVQARVVEVAFAVAGRDEHLEGVAQADLEESADDGLFGAEEDQARRPGDPLLAARVPGIEIGEVPVHAQDGVALPHRDDDEPARLDVAHRELLESRLRRGDSDRAIEIVLAQRHAPAGAVAQLHEES